MPGLLDLPAELIAAVGSELKTYRKIFRMTCKQVNAVLASDVLSLLVIDLPRNIDPTLALLEQFATSAENPSTWELCIRRLKITPFYPTHDAPWEAATFLKCSSHLRCYLQLAISSLKNLRHVSWDVGTKKEPGWLHSALVSGLATLPFLQSMEVNIRYSRNTRELRLERISTLSSLKVLFKDHYSNSAKHKPETLGLPLVIANNHSLKELDILITAFHSASQSQIHLNDLLEERSHGIERREHLTRLRVCGIVPAISQTTVQQLRFLKSIRIHSHGVGGSGHIEEFWRFILEEKVALEEIMTDRMTVGLGKYLKGSRGLRRLELLRLGSADKTPTAYLYRDILPGLASTLRRLVLRAHWEECWCIDPDSIKHISQCTGLRYLAVTVDGIRYARPDEPEDHITLLLNMVSENLRALRTLKVDMIRTPRAALYVHSKMNIKACILKYRSPLRRTALPNIKHAGTVYCPIKSGDGLMRYA